MKASKTTTSGLTILLFVLAFVLAVGCTDRRAKYEQQREEYNYQVPLVEPAASFQFNNSPTQAFQMVVRKGSLWVTGVPHAFMRMDISSDPERPQLIFAARDGLLSGQFTDLEDSVWTPQFYGSGSLEIMGNYAYMTGTLGMSVVNIGDTHRPVEVNRYPQWVDGEQTMDDRFIYRALAAHPSQAKLFGFRELDYIYGLVTSGSSISRIASAQSYPDNAECCTRGAAYFNGKFYVAKKNKLSRYTTSGSGLTYEGSTSALEAANVYATENYLYVHHRASTTSGSGVRGVGIYVLDKNLRQVARLPLDPYVFAVRENDSHIYVNDDNNTIRAYRINWNLINSYQ